MNRRLLIIDDTSAIHDNIRKVLAAPAPVDSELDALESFMFGDDDDVGVRPSARPQVKFSIDSAFQGQEGFERVQKAIDQDAPYAMVFVDMRMPPGWDGLETITHLLRVDPNLQIVICTAYADHAWSEIAETIDSKGQLLMLKKPFDAEEIVQLAHTLTEKWELERQTRLRVCSLESLVAEKSRELEVTLHHVGSMNQLLQGLSHALAPPIQQLTEGAEAYCEILRRVAVQLDSDDLATRLSRISKQTQEGLERVVQIARAMEALSRREPGSWEGTTVFTREFPFAASAD